MWDFSTVDRFAEKYAAVFTFSGDQVVARRVFFADFVGEEGVPVDFSERELRVLPNDLPECNMERVSALIDGGFIPLFYQGRVVFRRGDVKLPVPLPIDRHSTRSFQFSLGPCLVKGFDPKTGEVELSLSEDQYAKINRALAKNFSEQGLHSMAYASQQVGGGFSSAESLSLLKKGAEETGRIIDQELQKGHGTEEYAQSVEDKSKAVKGRTFAEKRLDKKEKEFESLLAKGRKGDINSTLKAIALNPSSFKPYFHALMGVAALSRIYPDLAKWLVDGAFEISPLLTLNVLLTTLFQYEYIAREDFPPVCVLLEERFPFELVVLGFINGLNRLDKCCLPDRVEKEMIVQDRFSNCLEEGLSAAFYRDFETAYSCFSEAKSYHFSDKRSYMFMAVLDLNKGDLLSAIKLTGWMGYLINWFDKSAKLRSLHWYFKGLEGDIHASPQDEVFIEVPVLKAVIALFREKELEAIKEKIEVFHKRFLEYLKSSEADSVWADLVLFVVEKRLETFVEDPSVRLQLLFELHAMISAQCYGELWRCNADLSAYEDIIETSDKGVRFSVPGLVTYPLRKKCMFSINRNSFRLRHDSYTSIVDAILWRRIHDVSPFFMRCGASNSRELLGFLQGIPLDGPPVFSPFLRAFISRLESEKDIEIIMEFFKWLLKSNNLVSEGDRPAIIHLFFSKLLESVVPCSGQEALYELGYRWLNQFSRAVSIGGVWEAADIWENFHKKEWNQVDRKLQAFFENWVENIDAGIDIIALRAVCLARALNSRKELRSCIPTNFQSSLHEDLCRMALSIVARAGVKQPLEIPGWDLSRKKIEDFCSLYIGPRVGETDDVYLKRLKELVLMDFSDLRNAERVDTSMNAKEPDQGWLIPLSSPDNHKCVQGIVEREIEIVETRLAKSALMQDEAPDYVQDQAFIEWVEGRKGLVAEYAKDPDAVINALPKVHENVVTQFRQELDRKVVHASSFENHKKRMPKVARDPGKRFWQLVQMTSDMIHLVHTTRRDEEMYDLVLENECEARLVALLLWEVGRGYYEEDILNFAGYFHGTEIHVWGEGPRINHINAGVFRDKKKPESVHLYFQ